MTSPGPPTVPPQAITAAKEAVMSRYGIPGDQADHAWIEGDVRLVLEAAAPHLAAPHEHIWVPCEQCKTPDKPCACSGGICCEGQRREIEEHAEGYAQGVATERDRGEALIIQAQDYARGESERADRLATLARDIVDRCSDTTWAQFGEWKLALQQLEDAAGDLAGPAPDPAEDAYRTGVASERERCAQHLCTTDPAAFLARHGLEPGAGAGRVLAAAAAELMREEAP